jgi:hypothetical protein
MCLQSLIWILTDAGPLAYPCLVFHDQWKRISLGPHTVDRPTVLGVYLVQSLLHTVPRPQLGRESTRSLLQQSFTTLWPGTHTSFWTDIAPSWETPIPSCGYLIFPLQNPLNEANLTDMLAALSVTADVLSC